MFEVGKTYETNGDGGDAMVAHVFPNGELLCVRNNEAWRGRPDGTFADGSDWTRDLLAPKPEPRRVWLDVYGFGGRIPTRTEFIEGPDGALRVVGDRP